MKYALVILLGLWSAIAPVHGVLGAALALTLIDMATGITAAYKRGEKISGSRGWRRTLVKLTIYDVAIISGFLCETYMTGPLVPAMRIAATLVGSVELKSILENLDSIYGGGLFQSIIAKLNGPAGAKPDPTDKH
jgi:hypothetical protein